MEKKCKITFSSKNSGIEMVERDDIYRRYSCSWRRQVEK